MLNLNTKNPSHQRVASDFVNGSITKSSSIENSQNKIEICIHQKSKLEKLFLNEINPNINIICGSKKYPLNKAYLRVDSLFFQKKFEENEELKEIVLDPSKFPEKDSEILEKVLRCLYGGKSKISVSRELQIDKLVNQLDLEILKNYLQFNFFTIFQLAVTYNDYELLNKSKEHLDECSFEILKESQYLEKMNSSYPQTFVDLDLEAARTILNINKQTNYLQVGETFDLIREYASNNQQTADIVSLVKEFLPQESLPAAQYKYIYSQLPHDESLFIQPKQSFSMRNQGLQESNILQYQLESENIYYQKKIKEMETQNHKLQEEMVKMKHEIEQKTDDFNKKEQTLILKLSNIENSVKQFEALDKGKEHEYNRKLQKLFKMIKEREVQLVEKEKQLSDLYTVLKNFTFQQQQPQNSQQQQTPENGQGQQQNQMKANTHQGFYNRHSSLQNYPDNTLMESHKMKSSDSSLMMTQHSIIYGGMQQSQLVPLSDLESMNQSMQSNRMFKNKLPNLNNNQSLFQPSNLTSNNTSFINNHNFMAPNIMNNFMQPIQEKKDSFVDQKAKGINNQELINSMEISQNEPNTNIADFNDNDEDTESTVMNNFLTFLDSSKVLEDCHLNYKTILSNLFDLSPFKKMSLKLLYRASRDKLTKSSFDSKVKNIPQTVVLVKSWEYDKLFGAFLSVPWSDEQGYQSDEEAFLFSISENKKIPVKNADTAIYQGEDHIFSFGTNDLTIVEKGDQDEINKSDYPSDYQEIKLEKNMPLNCLLAGNKSFQVDELEVFQIIIQEDMDF